MIYRPLYFAMKGQAIIGFCALCLFDGVKNAFLLWLQSNIIVWNPGFRATVIIILVMRE